MNAPLNSCVACGWTWRPGIAGFHNCGSELLSRVFSMAQAMGLPPPDETTNVKEMLLNMDQRIKQLVEIEISKP